MKGLDLARAYYRQLIAPFLTERLPHIGECHAAGLLGWGSDVLGNDDELSRDHEWGPRCVLFLPNHLAHLERETYEALDQALPAEFAGYPTRFVPSPEDPWVRVPSATGQGSVHIEVTTAEAYCRRNLGVVLPGSDLAWLSIPEHRLLELTGGELFYDGVGELTALRAHYARYYPRDVWYYRLAYAWQALGWDVDLIGLCARRGDMLSAWQARGMSVLRVMKLTFLLNRRYGPAYIKWLGREFGKLPHLARELGPLLERCEGEPRLERVPAMLEEVCRLLLRFQEHAGSAPMSDDAPYPFARGFFGLNCQKVADRIRAAIAGELRQLPLIGALDQWVGNYDLLLDVASLQNLGSIYGRAQAVCEGD